MRSVLLVALLTAWTPALRALADAPSGPAEKDWSAAGAPFDNPRAGPAVKERLAQQAPPKPPEGKCTQATEQRQAVAGAHVDPSKTYPRPEGWGPASWDKKPGYGRGLLGGLLGLIAAPLAFAYEAVEAALATPYRMINGLLHGDGWSLLEPLRTAKNLVQDGVMTVVGMLNSATAPVWNAVSPERSTDFMFANDRLYFIGGPMERVIGSFRDCYGRWEATTTSWHTTFIQRGTWTDSPGDGGGHSLLEHEAVHSVQWKRSFLWEKQSHDFFGGDYSAAKEPLNF